MTVFDPKRGRFTILDRTRNVQTVVTAPEVNQFMEKVRTAAAQNSEPFLQFLANPKFQASRTAIRSKRDKSPDRVSPPSDSTE